MPKYDRRRRRSIRRYRRPRAGSPYRTGTVIFSLVPQTQRMSSHEMLWLARRPAFDIVDQLIGEELHGPVRGPGDMRREDEIRAPYVEQRVTVLGRLHGQYVEAGAGDQPLVERLNQRRLIDQSA